MATLCCCLFDISHGNHDAASKMIFGDWTVRSLCDHDYARVTWIMGGLTSSSSSSWTRTSVLINFLWHFFRLLQFFCRWSRGKQRANKARPQTARVPGRSGAEPEPGQRGQRGGRAARHPARLSEPLGAGVPGAGKVDSWWDFWRVDLN